MSFWALCLKPLGHPRKALLAGFIAWKGLLLLTAACSPGDGYDTSTTLAQSYPITANPALLPQLGRRIATKLTRWDAIYFTTIADRGYVYEQEWAFAWGFTRLIRFFAYDLKQTTWPGGAYVESLVGVTVAHACHGLSVLALYDLTRAILPGAGSQKLAFLTASLHILSPAGIFLSSPYGESTFAFLNFSAYLLFVRSFNTHGPATWRQDILIASAGFLLGVASTFRSNGLLNGLIFVEECLRVMYSLRHGISLGAVRRLIATGFGGVCIALGSFLPQYIAFQKFCMTSSISDNQPLRIWCKRTIPSIYAFVQDHYWNVGFLRYWTVSNLPLFMLATPMLIILILSSIWAIRLDTSKYVGSTRPELDAKSLPQIGEAIPTTRRLLRSLAVPQLLLAVLTLTTYHVQIITRLSSGYYIWYLWLAAMLVDIGNTKSTDKTRHGNHITAAKIGATNPIWVVKYMILYAIIQAVLFSSFLPPA